MAVNLSNLGGITEWTTFTPTGSWTTNTTYTGRHQQIKDTLFVHVKVACAAAPNGVDLTLDVPAGFTVDGAKLLGDRANLGVATLVDTGVTVYAGAVSWTTSTFQVIRYNGSTVTVRASDANAVDAVSAFLPFSFAAGDAVIARWSFPVNEVI